MYRRIPRPHPDVPNQRSSAGLVYANIVMYASSCVQEGPIGPARGGSVAHYGLVIDQRTCVGCHACTVACKMENDVPPPPCRIQGRGARFRRHRLRRPGSAPGGQQAEESSAKQTRAHGNSADLCLERQRPQSPATKPVRRGETSTTPVHVPYVYIRIFIYLGRPLMLRVLRRP